IHQALKERIPLAYLKGFQVKELVKIFGVKKTAIYDCLTNSQLYDVVLEPGTSRCGKVDTLDIKYIHSIVKHRSTYLDEIQLELSSAHGTFASISTIYHTLQHLNFIHKWVSAIALKHDEQQMSIFRNHIADVLTDLEQLMFIDESAHN
ncbi:hypothetical protein BKA70DRAFT_1105503, partial [Coprinopsis sp. MPI-PUGE-AT-0042]